MIQPPEYHDRDEGMVVVVYVVMSLVALAAALVSFVMMMLSQ